MQSGLIRFLVLWFDLMTLRISEVSEFGRTTAKLSAAPLQCGIFLKDNAVPGDGETLTPLFGHYFSSGLQKRFPETF